MTTGSRKSYGVTGEIDRQYSICKVVNVDDPEQRGRCQVRMEGYQGDQGGIPDEMLTWAVPQASPLFPQMRGVGCSMTGLMKGSYVKCSHLDTDGQMIAMESTFTSAGDTEDGSSLDPSKHDVNRQFRTKETQGGDFKLARKKSA